MKAPKFTKRSDLVHVSEPVGVKFIDIYGTPRTMTVQFRLDGRPGVYSGTYRVDRSTLLGWEAIDGGKGAETIEAAKAIVVAYLQAVDAQRTLTPSMKVGFYANPV